MIADSEFLLGEFDLCDNNPVWTVRIKLKRNFNGIDIDDVFALFDQCSNCKPAHVQFSIAGTLGGNDPQVV